MDNLIGAQILSATHARLTIRPHLVNACSCKKYQQVDRCHTLYHYLQFATLFPSSPPPLNRIIMIYVITSKGSGSESDTTIESGILQQGRTA